MEGAITPLWIMAVVSVLEALVLIGIATYALIQYREIKQTVSELEARQIAPLRGKMEAILGEVQAITARVSNKTEKVDNAISTTIDRDDETAERVRGSVRDRVAAAQGVVR